MSPASVNETAKYTYVTLTPPTRTMMASGFSLPARSQPRAARPMAHQPSVRARRPTSSTSFRRSARAVRQRGGRAVPAQTGRPNVIGRDGPREGALLFGVRRGDLGLVVSELTMMTVMCERRRCGRQCSSRVGRHRRRLVPARERTGEPRGVSRAMAPPRVPARLIALLRRPPSGDGGSRRPV